MTAWILLLLPIVAQLQRNAEIRHLFLVAKVTLALRGTADTLPDTASYSSRWVLVSILSRSDSTGRINCQKQFRSIIKCLLTSLWSLSFFTGSSD